MFLLGFICGVLVLTALLLLCDAWGDVDEELSETRTMARAPTFDSWEQTRNFLYYDGTEMPIKKEERYE